MQSNEPNTQERILEAAQAEFLKRGFQAASLRTIVKTAGVTTGALYGYYASKEALFDALVEEHYKHFLSAFRNALDAFDHLPLAQQPERMSTVSQACLEELLLYMVDHREAFHLLLLCAEGTRYSIMKDELVQLEMNATHRYYRVLKDLGTPAPQIDPRLEYILVTGLMNAYFEMIIHDMPLADAQQYLRELHEFYSAGWLKMMGQ